MCGARSRRYADLFSFGARNCPIFLDLFRQTPRDVATPAILLIRGLVYPFSQLTTVISLQSINFATSIRSRTSIQQRADVLGTNAFRSSLRGDRQATTAGTTQLREPLGKVLAPVGYFVAARASSISVARSR
jgi:hypothetical protein